MLMNVDHVQDDDGVDYSKIQPSADHFAPPRGLYCHCVNNWANCGTSGRFFCICQNCFIIQLPYFDLRKYQNAAFLNTE